MEQLSGGQDPKSWAREVSARIGRNVREYRADRGLSAQKLSDATAALGFPIPRSTIANMEAGRKDAISVQEAFVLAEALRVPLAALLYSPLHPGETVRPVPSLNMPSYAAFNTVEWKSFPGPDEGARVTQALSVVRQMEFNRSMLLMLGQELAKEELGLKILKGGALKRTSKGVERVPPDESEMEKQRRDIEYYREQIALREQEDEEFVQGLRDLGVEPWPKGEHFSLEIRPKEDGDDA